MQRQRGRIHGLAFQAFALTGPTRFGQGPASASDISHQRKLPSRGVHHHAELYMIREEKDASVQSPLVQSPVLPGMPMQTPADAVAEFMIAANEETWKTRRKSIAQFIRMAKKVKEFRTKQIEKKAREQALPKSKLRVLFDKPELKDGKNAVLITTFAVAFGAILLRFGGRAALVTALGMDFIDSNIKNQIQDVVNQFNDAGFYKYAIYLGAWVVAKTFMVDFLSLALALSSSIVFGDPLVGGLASAGCATLASLPAFTASSYALKERLLKQVNQRPALRAMQKGLSVNGFKTVLVLRLSPLLPIPLGAYNYVYGASGVRVFDFVAGTFLGSLKPYILDSYLGSFLLVPLLTGVKQSTDTVAASTTATASDLNNDTWILIAFVIAVMVGTFASQIAASTYNEMVKEIDSQPPSGLQSGVADMKNEMAKDPSNNKPISFIESWMYMWGVDRAKLPGKSSLWYASFDKAWDNYWSVVSDTAQRLQAGQKIHPSSEEAAVITNFPRSGVAYRRYNYPTPLAPLNENGQVDWRLWTAESMVFTFLIPKILTEFSKPNTFGATDEDPTMLL